jgi:Carboxypeptidase regulatory-like domain
MSKWAPKVASILALITISFASPQGIPQTPRSSGFLVGRVIDAATNMPVTGAVVTLSGSGLRARRVIVDEQGRFLFTELPAGSFTISATRASYLDGSYGNLRPDGNGRTLDLQDGERVIDAVVRLWRSATISGVVTDENGEPMSGKTVQLLKRTVVAGQWRLVNSGLRVVSDERGRYRVAGLLPGDYALLITTHTSSLPTSLLLATDAMKRLTGPELSVFQRQLQTNGTFGYANDLSQGFPVLRVGDTLMQTDSGSVSVSPDGQSVKVTSTVWYPSGANASEALLVTVGPGDERTGVDVRLKTAKGVRVSGVVLGPDGPVPHLALRLVTAGNDVASAEVASSIALSLISASSVSDATGAFMFLGVAPGPYIIRALTTPPAPVEPRPQTQALTAANGLTSPFPAAGPAGPPLVSPEPTLWAATPVSAGETDLTGVTVTLKNGLRITGRVEFSGAAPKPDAAELRAIRLTMDPADARTVAYSSAYQAQIDSNSRFYTTGLIAGRYVLRIENPPRGWTLKSAVIGARDILDSPIALETEDVDGLVLTFTDRPSTVAGTVRDPQGRADDTATVLIFPADGNWTNLGVSPRRMRSVRASRTGTFTTSGLPGGDYYVVAVHDGLLSNWQDPAFLRKLAGIATRLTLAESQAVSLGLTTAGVER